MCFGKTPKYEAPPAPTVTPAPVVEPPPTVAMAAPLPSSTAEESGGQLTAAQQRRNKVAMARYGMLSTIKTSPQGITGAGADLNPADSTGKKKTLGS